MSYNRLDIRTEVRDEFSEPATAVVFITDAQLNKQINKEIRSLPSKDIYAEDVLAFSTSSNEYTLSSTTFKIESIERNVGTTTDPYWQEIKGWDTYGGKLYLPFKLSSSTDFRMFRKKTFSTLSDDSTSSDIPDDKMEVVIQGVICRSYRFVLSYLKDAKNWDSVAKPDGFDIGRILAVYQDAKRDYKELISLYKTVPKPRDINLIG